MGRAGGGRSGGGSRSSGSRSSSRSSGGHRVSSSRGSSRAGSGSSFNSSRGSSFGSRPGGGVGGGYRPPSQHMSPPPRHHNSYHPPRRTYYGGGHSAPVRQNTGCAVLIGMIALMMVIVMVLSMCTAIGGSSGIPASTVNREKVETGVAYQNDCIIDELDWFDNISSTSRELQEFYNETGIQPYIYLKAYDSSLETDAEKEAYALQWYEDNIDNEGTFLYMYFAEENQDGDVGYMCYVNGMQITTVMDAEAIDIFWAYLDSYWLTSMSTDDVFVKTFTKTADRIMDKSTTGADIGLWVVIGTVIIAAGVIVIRVMKTKRQHEKEKNEETERILNTPLGNTVTDDLADKYTSDWSDNSV